MSDVIAAEAQKAHTNALIELFTIDTTAINGGIIYRFTEGARDNGPISFAGQEYTPLPIKASGFTWDGQGRFPRPKLMVSNVGGIVSAALEQEDDLIGATVTRIRTYEHFLDDGDSPDPDAQFPLEIFTINQLTQQTNVFVEWELASVLDQTAKQLPGRIVLRDRCTHTYRLFDPETQMFSYAKVSCPFVGAGTFDKNGLVTNDAGDNCGRRLVDCKLRFGATAVLPYRGFPGVGLTRIR